MAYGDYRHCDVCDVKTFYDANLNYGVDDYGSPFDLERLGDWAVLCVECAKTHKCVVIKNDPTPPIGEAGKGEGHE